MDKIWNMKNIKMRKFYINNIFQGEMEELHGRRGGKGYREETGELQGTGNPGDSGRGGKGEKERERDTGGPEPPSEGKDSKLKIRDRV